MAYLDDKLFISRLMESNSLLSPKLLILYFMKGDVIATDI